MDKNYWSLEIRYSEIQLYCLYCSVIGETRCGITTAAAVVVMLLSLPLLIVFLFIVITAVSVSVLSLYCCCCQHCRDDCVTTAAVITSAVIVSLVPLRSPLLRTF